MAERTDCAANNSSLNKPKTQEWMKKRLEEWRKAKQQTAGELKTKSTALKTPNRDATKPSPHKKNISSVKRTMSNRPSSLHKAKENAAVVIKRKTVATLKNTAEKTADEFERLAKNSANKTAHTVQSKIDQQDDMVFSENPPNNFEIESEPDAKKARRSTFTIDSPNPEKIGQETKNPQPSLREQLEMWRVERSKRQTQTKVNSRQHKNSKEPTHSKSLKTKGMVGKNLQHQASNIPKSETSNLKPTVSNSKSAISNSKLITSKARPSTISKPIQKKTFPRKTNKHNYADKTPKKFVLTPNPSKESRNLLKTPTVKTPAYMNQSLPLSERLELWRREKRKTMPGKFLQTPSTVKKITKPRERTQENMKNKSVESPKVQPEMTERQNTFTLEEQNNEKENAQQPNSENASPQEIRQRLQECLIKVKEEQSSLDGISCQLDEIQKDHPDAIQFAEFWICRAKIAENTGDHSRVVCLYEQAAAFSAEPASLIKEEFSAYSLRRREVDELPKEASRQDVTSLEDTFDHSHGVCVEPLKQPVTPYRVGHTSGTMSPSSIVRYSVMKGTPFRSKLKTCERPTVTPVRRSVRLQRRSVNYPLMLQEHGLTVQHLDELPLDVKEEVSFRPNFAVESDLNEVWREIMES